MQKRRFMFFIHIGTKVLKIPQKIITVEFAIVGIFQWECFETGDFCCLNMRLHSNYIQGFHKIVDR